MTQRNALISALQYIQPLDLELPLEEPAARVIFVLEWLYDKNLFDELKIFWKGVTDEDELNAAYEALEKQREASTLKYSARLFNSIFGYDNPLAKWPAENIDLFVADLWGIVYDVV